MPRAFVLCVLAAAAAVLAACGTPESLIPDPLVVDTRGLETGAFRAELTGVIDRSISGTASSVTAPNIGIAIYLEGERYAVNLVIPHEILIGTHRITPLLSAYDSSQRIRSVGASVTDDVAPPDSILPLALYANVIEGRLTLTSIEPFTGAFELTTSDDLGATVTATGTFNAVVPEPLS